METGEKERREKKRRGTWASDRKGAACFENVRHPVFAYISRSGGSLLRSGVNYGLSPLNRT